MGMLLRCTCLPPPLPPAAPAHRRPLQTGCRQPGGDQIGYAEFSDKMSATKAKNLYHGWTGWGGRGLTIELTDVSLSHVTQLPGQKRMREGEGEACDAQPAGQTDSCCSRCCAAQYFQRKMRLGQGGKAHPEGAVRGKGAGARTDAGPLGAASGPAMPCR